MLSNLIIGDAGLNSVLSSLKGCWDTELMERVSRANSCMSARFLLVEHLSYLTVI